MKGETTLAKTKRKFVPTEEGQEKKADMTEEGRFDKLKIICPLTLAATTKLNKKPLAVNYTCVPESMIEVDESGVPGAWYSSPKGRGHEPAFLKELERRKALPKDDPEHIDWTNDGENPDVDGYYFSQEEGEEAREKYEAMVLAGETTITHEDGTEETIPVKGNAKSWRNKHAGYTGVSWDELMDMHPELYKTTTTKSTKKDKESEMEDQVAEGLVIESELENDEIKAEEEMAEEEEISPELVDSIEEEHQKEEEETEDEIEEIEAS